MSSTPRTGIVENESGGTDTVESAFSYTLPDNLEKLVLTGSAAVDGNGNSLNNELIGNGEANRLDGGIGADLMRGQGGSDTYIVDNIGDTVVEQAGGGADTVESSVSYAIGAEVERLTLHRLGSDRRDRQRSRQHHSRQRCRQHSRRGRRHRPHDWGPGQRYLCGR